MRAEQETNRRVCGSAYSRKYLDYIYVNELGELVRPNFITQNFTIVLANNKLKKIRQLRQSPVRTWCELERDSGMAWAQRYIHDFQHLHPLGLQFKSVLGECDFKCFSYLTFLRSRRNTAEITILFLKSRPFGRIRKARKPQMLCGFSGMVQQGNPNPNRFYC